MKTDTVAKSFIQDVVSKHGVPEKIITDRGTKFISAIYESMCKTLWTSHIRTTAIHKKAKVKLNDTILYFLFIFLILEQLLR